MNIPMDFEVAHSTGVSTFNENNVVPNRNIFSDHTLFNQMSDPRLGAPINPIVVSLNPPA